MSTPPPAMLAHTGTCTPLTVGTQAVPTVPTGTSHRTGCSNAKLSKVTTRGTTASAAAPGPETTTEEQGPHHPPPPPHPLPSASRPVPRSPRAPPTVGLSQRQHTTFSDEKKTFPESAQTLQRQSDTRLPSLLRKTTVGIINILQSLSSRLPVLIYSNREDVNDLSRVKSFRWSSQQGYSPLQ